MITSLHAVQILRETESFVHTQNAAGNSNSKVNGAIVLPQAEPLQGVSNSFLFFGDARNELRVPTAGFARLGEIRTGGYLAVVNKYDNGGGTVWTTGSAPGNPGLEKIGVIQGIGQVPGNDPTDNSITSVTGASFVDQEVFWICGTIEDPDPDGTVLQVQVSGLGIAGAEQEIYPWDRNAKGGFLMKWNLSSFTPTLIVPLVNTGSLANFHPTDVVAFDDGSALVMCVDEDDNWQLRKYQASGGFAWSWSLPGPGAKGVQLIEGQGFEEGNYFVLAEVSSPAGEGFGAQEVVLYCVTPNAANTGVDFVNPWHETVLGSSADDFAGAMCSHPDGTLSLAFTLKSGEAIFPILEPDSYGDLSKEHCIVTSLQRGAGNSVEVNWARSAAKAMADPGVTEWTMRVSRLNADPVGNLHLGITSAGAYEIECVDRTLDGSGGLISIDGAGHVWDFKRLPDFSTVGGVLGFGVNEQIALGDNGTGLRMSVFQPETVQNSYVVRSLNPGGADADTAMKALIRTVTEIGGQVHLEMRHERFGIYSVAVFLTPGQLERVGLDETLSVDPDPPIITQNNGQASTQTGAGWALRRLNQHGDASASPGSSYQFWLDDGVEADERPWVFLLDTGLPALRINDLSGSRFAPPYDPSRPVEMSWSEQILDAPIGANANDGEYEVNLDSDHAEKVTALMAFLPFGSGQGIPFQLENINIYPDRGTGLIVTYPSYIADGIFLAVDKVLDERELPTGPKTGALIVIPSSGQSMVALTEYDTLELALDEALDANIPIILSAGNTTNAPVETTVPAGYGNRSGIITIGATTLTEGGVLNARALAQTIDSSGTNETITLYAPGVAVPVGGGETFSGTSASCALAAGVAAAILSSNPDITPEVLENAMIANSVFQSTDEINLLTLNTTIPQGCGFQDWLTIHGLTGQGLWADSDLDELNHLEEYLGNSDPTDSTSHTGPFLIPRRGDGEWILEIELPTWVLSSSDPFQILDLGCGTMIEVKLEWSQDLENWTVGETGGWDLGPADIARRVTPLLFTVPESSIGEKRFWRFTLQQLP